jgi:hypothetical protein
MSSLKDGMKRSCYVSVDTLMQAGVSVFANAVFANTVLNARSVAVNECITNKSDLLDF